MSGISRASRFAVIGASALVLRGATAMSQATPGYSYSLRYSAGMKNASEEMATAMASLAQTWSGTTVFAGGRGRTDITDGQMKDMWQTGDYMLFDSTGYIIVHPATKTFFGFPKDLGKMVSGPTGGVGKTISDVSVKLDTLGAGEPIDGYATRRYRMVSKFTLTLDMSSLGADAAQFAPPPLTSTSTTEFWLTDRALLPSGAVMASFGAGTGASAGMSGLTGGLGDLVAKMTAMRASLTKGAVALRTVTSQQMSGMPAMSGGLEMTSEIRDIKTTNVDLGQLVLPDGYTESSPPAFGKLAGASPMTADEAGRWRAKPHGG